MNKNILLLIFIFIFASFIRIFHVTENPEGFYQNEASWGYNAYSLYTTGKDEYGRLLPIVLESFGDYKMAFHAYYLIPYVKILGLNEFSVRFGTIIASMISLCFVYLVVIELFKNRKLALLSTFILSILPWHVVFSRIGNETMTAFMFYLINIYLFTKWTKTKKITFFIFSIFFSILSILTYYSVWIPIAVNTIVYFFIIFKGKKPIKEFTFKSLLLFIPIIVIIISYKSTGSDRLRQINIFQNSGTQPLLEEQIREDQKEYSYFITRLMHNKITFYPSFILQNYFKTLSFDFLFLNGDRGEQVYKIPYNGVIYSILSPILIFGLILNLKNIRKVNSYLVLIFIFVLFIGNAMSIFGSESQRTLVASWVFGIITATGLLWFYQKTIRNKYLMFSFIILYILLIYQLTDFNHQYYHHANTNKPWFRNYGSKEMILTLNALKNQYEKVIITGNSQVYIYYYFYNKIDPSLAQKESSELLNQKDALSHPYRKMVGDFIIMPSDCPIAGKIGILYVCKGNIIPKNSRIIKTIYYKDNQPAFIFIEFTENEQNTILPNPIKYSTKYGLINKDEKIYWISEEEMIKSEKI